MLAESGVEGNQTRRIFRAYRTQTHTGAVTERRLALQVVRINRILSHDEAIVAHQRVGGGMGSSAAPRASDSLALAPRRFRIEWQGRRASTYHPTSIVVGASRVRLTYISGLSSAEYLTPFVSVASITSSGPPRSERVSRAVPCEPVANTFPALSVRVPLSRNTPICLALDA